MPQFKQRTDLAIEARELAGGTQQAEIPGVEYEEQLRKGVKCHVLSVKTQEAAKKMGKPIGKYCTVELDQLVRRESDDFSFFVEAIGELVRNFVGDEALGGDILVAGLGNRDITPDAIGPYAASNTLVTRHLKVHYPADFGAFLPVSVLTPGVLGTSGIESADYIRSICSDLSPSAVVLVDALAARSPDRLCRSIQITDTGITPGSGVGNSRSAISSEQLGVPVIAVGVPTVVDISSLLIDMGKPGSEKLPEETRQMIVTPRDIDSQASALGRLVGYAINFALHKGITIEDIDMLLG